MEHVGSDAVSLKFRLGSSFAEPSSTTTDKAIGKRWIAPQFISASLSRIRSTLRQAHAREHQYRQTGESAPFRRSGYEPRRHIRPALRTRRDTNPRYERF